MPSAPLRAMLLTTAGGGYLRLTEGASARPTNPIAQFGYDLASRNPFEHRNCVAFWLRLVCWMVRCEYTCLAVPFDIDKPYETLRLVEKTFNTAAYNKRSLAKWDCLSP